MITSIAIDAIRFLMMPLLVVNGSARLEIIRAHNSVFTEKGQALN